jgi:maltose alpha-D-glucosyltransferase/alpha-amylase
VTGNTGAVDITSRGWVSLLAGHGAPQLQTALKGWLPRQRWFGAKTRRIRTANVFEWVALPDTSGSSALVFIQIDYEEGPPSDFQLPLAIGTGTEAERIAVENPECVLTALTTKAGSDIVYDATTREDFRRALLALIRSNSTLAVVSAQSSGEVNPLDASQQPIGSRLESRASSTFADRPVNERIPSRVGSAEQSNTSILYGDALILKLFRRLQPGENPDVEIGRFLTDVAHFRHIAPFLGEVAITHTTGDKTTVAMLQALLPNHGDGWEWFLNQLRLFFGEVSTRPAPPAPAPRGFLAERPPLPIAIVPAHSLLAAAALLGRRTAEMHLALSSSRDIFDFAPEAITTEDLERDAQRIETQIDSALKALKMGLSNLNPPISDAAGVLLSRQDELVARAQAILRLPAKGERIRIHGDYHLGQTLRTGSEPGDFVLLDFEGEPARSLAERRSKQSPLKDVAGMIRSFSYVAYAALDKFLADNREGSQPINSTDLAAWAELWRNAASAEFLWAYREAISANKTLLPPPEQSQDLLGAYLLEKALYELLYELNNRPAWLHIPIAGILSS